MNKTLIICNQRPSHWISVNPIKNNLIKCYQSLAHKIDITWINPEQLKTCTQDFINIILIESNSDNIGILQNFLRSSGKKFRIFIHLYGDFSLNLDKWKQIENDLKRHSLCFLCASPSQEKQVNEFINSSLTTVLPFSIDSTEYSPNYQTELNSGSPFNIIFSGRFSTQKNTLLSLIWTLDVLKTNTAQQFNIQFVGKFDDMGAPIVGQKEPLGFNYFLWKDIVNKYKIFDHINIQFIPHVEKNVLQEILQEADLLISLSTYHDEDFGMAPLEGLFCGCRALLTNWGGYNSYSDIHEKIGMVPVTLSVNGLTIDRAIFNKHLMSLITSKVAHEEKEKHFLMLDSLFGISVTAELLGEILDHNWPVFNNFKPYLTERASKIKKFKTAQLPFFKKISTRDFHYFRIYRHYMLPQKKTT